MRPNTRLNAAAPRLKTPHTETIIIHGATPAEPSVRAWYEYTTRTFTRPGLFGAYVSQPLTPAEYAAVKRASMENARAQRRRVTVLSTYGAPQTRRRVVA